MIITDVFFQLAPDQGMVPADHPTELRRRCEEEAQQMVQLSNSLKDSQQSLPNPSLTHLISRLTALLLQIKVQETLSSSAFVPAHKFPKVGSNDCPQYLF